LALNKRLSASSQRQALNALVFLYREVFGKQLGDFFDYRRAQARTHLPVWLTKEEIERLFACLEPDMRLMARLMYGSGLRSKLSIVLGPQLRARCATFRKRL
jgi:integrase